MTTSCDYADAPEWLRDAFWAAAAKGDGQGGVEFSTEKGLDAVWAAISARIGSETPPRAIGLSTDEYRWWVQGWNDCKEHFARGHSGGSATHE